MLVRLNADITIAGSQDDCLVLDIPLYGMTDEMANALSVLQDSIARDNPDVPESHINDMLMDTIRRLGLLQIMMGVSDIAESDQPFYRLNHISFDSKAFDPKRSQQ